MSRMAFCKTPPTGHSAKLAARFQDLVPVLTTERLILRATKIEDFDAFSRMLQSPGGEFFGEAESFEDIWAEFLHLTGMWMLRGHGGWTVTMRDTGAVAGFVQIGAEPGDQEPELGYLVAPEFRGQGVALEAANAAKSYAFETMGLATLISYVDADNIPSQKLAERMGAIRDQDAEAALGEADPCLAFRYAPERAGR